MYMHTYVKQMRQYARKCHYYRCLNMQAKMAHFVIFGQIKFCCMYVIPGCLNPLDFTVLHAAILLLTLLMLCISLPSLLSLSSLQKSSLAQLQLEVPAVSMALNNSSSPLHQVCVCGMCVSVECV